MKLKEMNDAIAAACNVRPNVVSQVQTETFRALRMAIDKGEKVIIPEFGIFLMRDVPGEEGAPGKKIVRFKARSGEKKDKKEKKEKKEKRAKAAGTESKSAPAGADDDGED